MIIYTNYLTIPSGKYYNLKEINNKEYLVLLKFLNGDNFKGFYNALDLLIKESIEDFDSLDICDKAYIYIAYYYYSIRASIALKSANFDSVEIPLHILLNSIENNYKKSLLTYKFYKWNAEVHYPKKLLFDDNNTIIIDILSSLRTIENNTIDDNSLETLRKVVPTKILSELSYYINKNLTLNVEFSKNIQGVDDITENILSPSIFYSIAQIYKDTLENFYNMLYLMSHYIRVDWQSLLDMTPVETMILYKNFIKDKEKQNENSKSGNTSIINNPALTDLI